jgi:hypothetical protein
MKSKLVALICLFLFLPACCYPVRYDGPYKGRVIDADTGQPIEGVVVLGVWSKVAATPAGGVSSYYDAQETVTDRNGEFEIPGLGLKILSKVAPMNAIIFKVGYEHLNVSWELIRENKFNDKKIKWDGKRAIIPLRKWSLEERRNRFGDYYVSGVPDEKRKLLLREIEREDKEIGK